MSVLAALLVRSPLGVLLSCSARRAGRARGSGTWVWSRHVQWGTPLSAPDSDRPGRLHAARTPCLPIRALLSLRLRSLGPGRARPYTPGADQQAGPGQDEPVQRSLEKLYENPWTIPNLLSMTRIGLSPVLGYLIVGEDFNVALGIFALAGVTDLLDGYIARNWANQKSALGSALDPLADKILISVLYVCLTYASLIPVPLTVMIILRDVALIAAVFYVRYKTLPLPRTVGKYFNPCYATARLEPTFISKMNTAVQLILVAASLAAPVFNFVDSVYLQALWCITGFTTVASAYSYYHYGQKTVKILNK